MRFFNLLLFTTVICLGLTASGCISAKKSKFQIPGVGMFTKQEEKKSAEEERAILEQTNKLFAAGLKAEQQGDIQSAHWAYLNCLKVKDGQKYLGPPYHRLAVLAARTGDYEKSELYFRKALELGTLNPELACDYAQMLYDTDRPREAETILANALITHPKNKKLLFFLGHAVAMQNRPVEAHRHMKEAVGEAESYQEIAEIMRQQGKSSEADHFDQKSLVAQSRQRPMDRMREEMSMELAGLEKSDLELHIYASLTPKLGSLNLRYNELTHDQRELARMKEEARLAANQPTLTPAEVMHKYGPPASGPMMNALPTNMATAQPKFSDLSPSFAPGTGRSIAAPPQPQMQSNLFAQNTHQHNIVTETQTQTQAKNVPEPKSFEPETISIAPTPLPRTEIVRTPVQTPRIAPALPTPKDEPKPQEIFPNENSDSLFEPFDSEALAELFPKEEDETQLADSRDPGQTLFEKFDEYFENGAEEETEVLELLIPEPELLAQDEPKTEVEPPNSQSFEQFLAELDTTPAKIEEPKLAIAPPAPKVETPKAQPKPEVKPIEQPKLEAKIEEPKLAVVPKVEPPKAQPKPEVKPIEQPKPETKIEEPKLAFVPKVEPPKAQPKPEVKPIEQPKLEAKIEEPKLAVAPEVEPPKAQPKPEVKPIEQPKLETKIEEPKLAIAPKVEPPKAQPKPEVKPIEQPKLEAKIEEPKFAVAPKLEPPKAQPKPEVKPIEQPKLETKIEEPKFALNSQNVPKEKSTFTFIEPGAKPTVKESPRKTEEAPKVAISEVKPIRETVKAQPGSPQQRPALATPKKSPRPRSDGAEQIAKSVTPPRTLKDIQETKTATLLNPETQEKSTLTVREIKSASPKITRNASSKTPAKSESETMVLNITKENEPTISLRDKPANHNEKAPAKEETPTRDPRIAIRGTKIEVGSAKSLAFTEKPASSSASPPSDVKAADPAKTLQPTSPPGKSVSIRWNDSEEKAPFVGAGNTVTQQPVKSAQDVKQEPHPAIKAASASTVKAPRTNTVANPRKLIRTGPSLVLR